MVAYFIIGLQIFICSVIIRYYKFIYQVIKTLPRDIKIIFKLGTGYIHIWKLEKSHSNLVTLFQETVRKHPHKIAFYLEEQKWTFRELDLFSNRIAHYFKNKGFKKYDTVSLLLDNSPDYVGIWLGLSKIGVVTALINTNLVSDSLVHCIKVAKSKGVIFGSNYSKTVFNIEELINDVQLFKYNEAFKTDLLNQSATLPTEIKNLEYRDIIFYIYTSGTTGLPKAAPVSHKRFILIGILLQSILELTEKDTFYNPLPLYHSAGGQLALSQTLLGGLTMVLRKKFSVTHHWSDCEKFDCTISIYIGEICRYLLAAHKPGNSIKHNVRKMMGSGLRPQLWDSFIEAFKINHIFEFYGSTEGNSAVVNLDNKKGAIGFIPIWAKSIFSEVILRCDSNTGEPTRNSKGFCIRCDDNEPGLMAMKIDAKKEFLGYTDKVSTQKKILRDVFMKGDKYYNTGDIIVQDELGYLYFRDRTGDTFRWKGENVATNEVEDIMHHALNLRDVIVYGVEIPGTEGKAGMAAVLDEDNSINFKELAENVKSKLPSYAIPLFLRILPSVPLTGTFKLQKTSLKKQGFQVQDIDDPLYFYDALKTEYVPLNETLFNNIINNKIKL